MTHHVAVVLPDGRRAIADYRQPIVHVIRQVHQFTMLAADRRLTASEKLARGEALGVVAEWLDQHPEQACVSDDGPCSHGPASREPFTPPPYRRTP